MLADITVGDVLELMDREADYFACPVRDHKVFYRMLRELGIFGDEAPERLRAFRTAGQLAPEELVDRYQLQSGPSGTCSWTTCGNASPPWTTPA